MVRAESRDQAAVLEALNTGRFYGSSGAVLHDLRVGPDAIEVECSPAVAVTLRSGPWDGGRVNADPRRMNWRGEALGRSPQGLITAARFRLPERWPWARVDVAATHGVRAWTTPAAGGAGSRPVGRGRLAAGSLTGSGPRAPEHPCSGAQARGLARRCLSRWLCPTHAARPRARTVLPPPERGGSTAGWQRSQTSPR